VKRIAVLISNKGKSTNLQAIINAVESGIIHAKIIVVVSDTQDAYGVKRAAKHQLKVEICQKKEYLLSILKKYDPAYIALAGWKQIILDEVIDAFPNRILNVHPGLIPDSPDGIVTAPDNTQALWNKGKFADKAIQNFLDQKSTYAGSTIHFLSNEFDFGPVLKRGFVKVHKNDTIDSLYERLKKEEHKIYIESLQKLCQPE